MNMYSKLRAFRLVKFCSSAHSAWQETSGSEVASRNPSGGGKFARGARDLTKSKEVEGRRGGGVEGGEQTRGAVVGARAGTCAEKSLLPVTTSGRTGTRAGKLLQLPASSGEFQAHDEVRARRSNPEVVCFVPHNV